METNFIKDLEMAITMPDYQIYDLKSKTLISRILSGENIHDKISDWSENDRNNLNSLIKIHSTEIEKVRRLNTAKVLANGVQDFDWNVKYCLGSDKLMRIEEPLLEIHLKTQEEVISLEMNKEELEGVIQAFTKIEGKLSE